MDTVIEDVAKMKKVNAPFGYFGSKNKIALQLCTHLPPHNCWVEAFCGSAALTLRKKPAPIEVINDFDHQIVNFFKQLRDNSAALCEQIELTPYAEQELIDARSVIEGLSDLEKARRFLVQSMMAINGVFGEERGGFSYSDSYSRNGHDARVNRWNNLPERLKLVVKRLKDVRIENKDAIKILNKYINRPATLVYLDPPYLGKRTNGYNKDANDESFHKKLLTLANKAKCMIFISGYESELYNSLLTDQNGWQRKTITTTTKGVTGKSFNRLEVLWMNHHFVDALKNNEVPIILTDKERLQGKVNPERF
ncbi:DNA adenine methylase [Mucilaginibacter sp. cycad4]|uniref:DNA adenine methylase n=1 Tax=Mucilaginibacter sp. cycad4 TaxID=3342096 RepID=UPI002AABDB99|nr:DNA adenine methylase [Mucilaginibacter gossypii]WPU97874.1 DNA adenine methylase [Mucilaginibacter gossypii]